MRLSSHNRTRRGSARQATGSSFAGGRFLGGRFHAGNDARSRASCNCAGLIGLVRQLANATLANAGLSARTPIGSQQNQRQHRRAGQLADFCGEHQAVHVRAFACRECARSNASPCCSQSSACCAAMGAARESCPTLLVCKVRMRRLVGLSSTISKPQIGQLRLRSLQRGLRRRPQPAGTAG